MNPRLPLFEQMQRRAALRRLAAIGALGLVPGIACSSDDAGQLGTATVSTTTTTAAAAALDTTTSTAAGSGGSGTSDATSGSALPTGAELEVAFTYAADGGGEVRNPFVAVWVQDEAGNLVRNVALWYNPPKGERWINHLASWYSVDQAYADAGGTLDYQSVSGATRPAGTYRVVWDGSTEDGGRAAPGTYTVFVEAAREHGPHSISSATIELDASGASVTLPTDNELNSLTATYTV